MATLYLRGVPDEVREGLAELARREGMSVSAFAVRELTAASRRARNRVLLADLPSYEIDVDEIVAGIEADRER